ncbi:alpha-1,2-mannosyltransferase ALG9-like [Babylonia areolata]|uniref:alpha-1,2-mannosyltransferase ALG9-like n=1 Tax=Babylonia areolata TaxID=304850 RepID=UPI003FD01BB0
MSGNPRRRHGQRLHREAALTNAEKQSDRRDSKPRPVICDPQEPWALTTITAFKLLTSARLCAALWNIITDCDEVFNYWEPAHYLLYGYGFQTWEYSPVYAIRSYAYILLHALPLKVFQTVITDNKILVFYLLRCVLGVVCAGCEVYLYRAVKLYVGSNIARLTLWFLLLSTGLFISSTAFLPSSFSMLLTMVATAAWLSCRQQGIAILAVAASAIIGWPFAAALGLPIAADILFRQKRVMEFTLWCVIALLVFLVPVVLIDSHYFGKFVIAPLNIMMYNVFSDHGPDLYGVEPLSYYLMNGFLNFNIVFFLALLSLPMALLVSLLVQLPADSRFPAWLLLTPMYIWIVIFFTQPHKEERFLFPIYPFFAIGGSVFLDSVQRAWSYILPDKSRSRYTDGSSMVSVFTAILFSLLCLSRSVALYQGYHASMDVYVELQRVANDPRIHTLPQDKNVNVCVGKEWYRFPSNFFLPSDRWHLQFIKSEFRGLLPKPYEPGEDGTRVIPSHMNDLNKEEPTRYIDISRCHYLIDLDLPTESEVELRYSESDDWTVVANATFVDASRSHRLMRAFYVPFVSWKYCTYVNYNVLKTTRTKKSTKPKKS